jgi:hypothetical protein
MEKFADLMIFRHENALRLQEFAYLCKREVKWTLSQTFERLELHLSAFWTGFEYLAMPSTGCASAMFKTCFDIAFGLHCTCKNLTCTVQILKVLTVKII